MRGRTALIGTLTLIIGFTVAQTTGVRWLGAVVLIAGGAVAATLGWRLAGPLRTVAAIVVFFTAFALSHPLSHVVGAWPSVLLMSVGSGLVAYWLLEPRSLD